MSMFNNLFSGFNDPKHMDRFQKQARSSMISTFVILGIFAALTVVLIIVALIGSIL